MQLLTLLHKQDINLAQGHRKVPQYGLHDHVLKRFLLLYFDFELNSYISGMTISIPNISFSGNINPASMTNISSSTSTTYIFLPISPTPPNSYKLNTFIFYFLQIKLPPMLYYADRNQYILIILELRKPLQLLNAKVVPFMKCYLRKIKF